MYFMLIKYFRKSEYFKNVVTLFTGSTIEYAIPLLIAPILTRLYKPEDFGLFALYMSVAQMFTVVATGRYEMAVMLPKSDKESLNIFSLGFVITVFISVLSLIIVSSFNSQICYLVNNQDVSKWLYFVPLSVILFGTYQLFINWFSRKKKFTFVSVSRISQATANAATSLSIGFMNKGVIGLIGGNIFGMLAANIIFALRFLKKYGKRLAFVNIKEMKVQAKKYNELPTINSLHAFMDIFQLSLFNFIISSFFGAAVLGFFSFTYGKLRSPLRLISGSISQVFFQRASEIKENNGDIRPLLRKNIFGAFLIALPIGLLLLFFGPSIFGFVFGKEWTIAGRYAQILAPMIFLNFISSPVSSIPLVMRRLKSFFLISFIGYVFVFAMFLIGYLYYKDFMTALMFYSGAFTVFLLFVIVWFFIIAGKKNQT